MDKRLVRERILEVLDSSPTDVADWDPTVKDELAEEIATVIVKLDMESVFDIEAYDDDLDE